MKRNPDRQDIEQGRFLKDLRVFHDVARALTSTLDRDTVLSTIMAQMAQFFSPQCWSLLLLDEKEQELYFAVVEGRFDAEGARIRIPVYEGLAGWVMKNGQPLIVPDVPAALESIDTTAIRFSPAEQKALSFEVKSAIALPLQSRGRTLGVIQLFNYRLESLTDYAMTFLHILTDYAAIAIENARAVERIHELTITDDPTRLFNTRHLHASLQIEFERARRFHTQFSIIFVDLDNFKRVNDAHGHLIGTELLIEVAQLIKVNTRSVDMVFRYGGDEFVVLLPQTGKTAAVETAQRLRQSMNDAFFLSGSRKDRGDYAEAARDLKLTVSASFGVSTYPEDGDDPEAVLKAADMLMYSVKHSTRDNVAFA